MVPFVSLPLAFAGGNNEIPPLLSCWKPWQGLLNRGEKQRTEIEWVCLNER
jgi:hypothetical protein